MPDIFDELNKIENVSRETFSRLEAFIELLTQWNPRINLVSKNSVAEVWQRHVLDSAQLLRYIPQDSKILSDFGSGGGFPGVVLAFLRPWREVHLIESDARKCAFLTQATALCPGNIHIHTQRIETLSPWESDIITARALAPVDKLFELLSCFIQKSKISLFLKGQNVVEELDIASKCWDFSYHLHPSITEEQARIIEVQHVSRRNQS